MEPVDELGGSGRDTDPQEAAWQTAVEAALWLVGEPGKSVDPPELYEKLKPFEERVESDIESTGELHASPRLRSALAGSIPRR
jgi:hypothetical protein